MKIAVQHRFVALGHQIAQPLAKRGIAPDGPAMMMIRHHEQRSPIDPDLGQAVEDLRHRLRGMR